MSYSVDFNQPAPGVLSTSGAKLRKKMYLGKRAIKNPEEYERLRALELKDKLGATHLMFSELEGLINLSSLARQYFGKSQSWLSQKIHGCTVLDKKKQFTPEEYARLSEALRHIAARLQAHADEIDAAPMNETVSKDEI